MTKIKISDKQKGIFGIVGHVGVGHINSHSGFVQDDSAGFAVASLLLGQAAPADTVIDKVKASADDNTITVTTRSGGRGTTSPRRGITPREAEIAATASGLNALYTQNTAIDVFGRIYGQGAAEVPVSLQGACALAVLDSFKRVLGDKLLVTKEKFPNKYDVSAGTVIDIDGIPVSLLLVINGTNGGIGPDEDYEGNTNWTEKGRIMEQLGLNDIPTTVIESKAFIPGMADSVKENQYMIRAQEGVDCMQLGQALYDSAAYLGLPARYEKNLMPMPNGALAKATASFADSVIEAAKMLRESDSAADKVKYTAEIAKLISEDAGGVTFMSSSLNDKVRGAGTLPKISAVLSMVTTREYQAHWKIPKLEPKEAEGYQSIIIGAIKSLAQETQK
jgi:hypothetical protein